MTRYDPLPTHDNDINNTTTTATPQPRSSSSPNSNNHQRPHIPSSSNSPHPPPPPQVLPSSSSSSPTSTHSSFYVGNNLLNNNTANSNNSSFFPDFTNAIRTRAASIISTSTSPNSSQRSSYSDHGSESSAPHMPLLPQANINSLSPYQLEAGLARLSTSPRDSNDNTKGVDSINHRSCYCCKPSTSTTRITPRHVIRLRWIWVLAFLAGEHGTFWVMVNRCSWPESSSWVIILDLRFDC
ncbi:MAG: hypothetical protein J3R72DRAFT_423606 [Linnemannia gamsii]|nr:MAG: hypothetical protein J3R72DRAFT_423606 [Linnemannia gamsii]